MAANATNKIGPVITPDRANMLVIQLSQKTMNIASNA